MIRLLIEPFQTPFMARALIEAVLLSMLAGVVSVFVVLRRLEFMADALSHTVFPGVVIGYLLASTDGIVWGALCAAVLAVVVFTIMTAHRRVTQDSSLAIILTGFFAIGVVMVSRQSSYTSDLTTFLFGQILTVNERDIAQTAVAGLAILIVVMTLRKELLLRTFDPQGSQAMGYPVFLLDLVLNLCIALVIIVSVRSVGTILVLALLIVPAATARLLTDQLPMTFVLSTLVGALAGWWGLAVSYEASINHGVRLASGATIVLVLVALYVLAAIGRVVRSRNRQEIRDPHELAG